MAKAVKQKLGNQRNQLIFGGGFVLLLLLGLLATVFYEGSVIGADSTYELDSCSEIYVQGDQYVAENCGIDGSISDFIQEGEGIAIYPYGIGQLETADQSNPDMYGYFAKHLVASETSLQADDIQTGSDCKTQYVYEPYICSDDPDSMKTVLDGHGISYHTWDRAGRINSQYNEILSIESHSELGDVFGEHGSCEAELSSIHSVEGSTEYGSDLRSGEMACVFQVENPDIWSGANPVSVDFSFDLGMTRFVEEWVYTGGECRLEEFEEGSVPAASYDSESQCIELNTDDSGDEDSGDNDERSGSGGDDGSDSGDDQDNDSFLNWISNLFGGLWQVLTFQG